MAAGVCTSPGKGGRWGRVGKVIRNDFEEFSKLDGLEPRLAAAVANQQAGLLVMDWAGVGVRIGTRHKRQEPGSAAN